MTESHKGVARAGPMAVARFLWLELTPFVRRRLAGVFALVIAAAVLTALSPVALKIMVDELSSARPGLSSAPMAAVTLYVLSLCLARIANQFREILFGGANQRVFRLLSERLFLHLMQLPLRFHLDRRTGAVSQTLEDGLGGLRIALQHLVFTCLPMTVELATVLLVLERLLTPSFLFLFCGALVCYAVAFGCSATGIAEAARRASAARVEAAAVMTDGLLNYETVKYFTAEALVHDRVMGALSRSESEWTSFYRQYARTGLLLAAVFVAFLGSTVLYAAEEVQRARMSLGDFVLVNTYMLQIVRPVEMMGYAMQGLSQGMGMLEKLVQTFREPVEIRVSSQECGVAGPGCLRFQEVSLAYGGGRLVLNKVSFRVAAGGTLGIVGPSGSGKSTIVRLLVRLLEPESGMILLDDVPISGMSLQDLRRLVAVVSQQTTLFDETIRYNIGFGRADASPQEIEEAAKIAQLHDLIMTLPDGYDTRVGERGVKLSGGERQRVSIARAVLKSPKIYVFDEATSCLDSRTEGEVLRSLRTISDSNTTLMIAHRLSTVVDADEIAVLENGHIVEQGTHQVLLRQNGTYATLWQAQRRGAVAA